MKALEKLYSIMPIKCSFDPLFVRQQRKLTWKLHIWWLFYWEKDLHTNNIGWQLNILTDTPTGNMIEVKKSLLFLCKGV